jgi:hypothetical protein
MRCSPKLFSSLVASATTSNSPDREVAEINLSQPEETTTMTCIRRLIDEHL